MKTRAAVAFTLEVPKAGEVLVEIMPASRHETIRSAVLV